MQDSKDASKHHIQIKTEAQACEVFDHHQRQPWSKKDSKRQWEPS